MGALKKTVSSLGRTFKKVFAKLKKNLAILLIIVAVVLLVYVGWAYLGFAGTGFLSSELLFGYSAGTILGASFLSLAGAYYIDSGTARAATQKVTDAVKGATRSIGVLGATAVAGAVGGAIAGIPWYVIAGGVALLIFLISERRENEIQHS